MMILGGVAVGVLTWVDDELEGVAAVLLAVGLGVAMASRESLVEPSR
jgi:hypothetical protein